MPIYKLYKLPTRSSVPPKRVTSTSYRRVPSHISIQRSADSNRAVLLPSTLLLASSIGPANHKHHHIQCQPHVLSSSISLRYSAATLSQSGRTLGDIFRTLKTVGIWFEEQDRLFATEESRGDLASSHLYVRRDIQSCSTRSPRYGKSEPLASSLIRTNAYMEAFTMWNLASDHRLLISQLEFLGKGIDTRNFITARQNRLANMTIINVSTVDADQAPARSV